MPPCTPPIDERLHPPGRIASLVAALAADDESTAGLLAGTGLRAADLADLATRTSIRQYLVVCGNALARPPGRVPPIRSRLADHGLYGLLLLSCESVRDVFRLAVRYQWLATPIVAIDTVETDDGIAWTIASDALADVPEPLRPFVVEQRFAELAAHLCEALGWPATPAPPGGIADGAHPADRRAFDDAPHALRYPKGILTRRPPLANPVAATMLKATCDGLVAEMEASLGMAGLVVRTLRRMRDPAARMKVVASELKMTDRTLRRRLADEGTCFSTISHHAKFAAATRHLKASSASIDEIATIAGFSDPANFRRAFIRWTSMSPAQFRRSRAA